MAGDPSSEEGTAVAVLDAALRFRAANDEALALLGYDRDELLALTADRVIAFSDEWLRREYAALQAEGVWRGDVAARRKDGRLVHITAAATYLEHPGGAQIVVRFRLHAA